MGPIMTFPGMTGLSSDWIEDYAIKTAPLREIMKEVGKQTLTAPLQLENDALITFETIKQEMQTALSFATPNYTEPFLLYVSN